MRLSFFFSSNVHLLSLRIAFFISDRNIELKPGAALIFLASCWHGAGHNSVPGFTRVLHGLFFCRGTYRTQENQFLAIPRSKALSMSPKMLNLLGYKQPGAALGMVENADPMLDLEHFLREANL